MSKLQEENKVLKVILKLCNFDRKKIVLLSSYHWAERNNWNEDKEYEFMSEYNNFQLSKEEYFLIKKYLKEEQNGN